MSITITKVRLNKVIAERDTEGKITLTGSYELVTDKGNVIAKQGFNGYGETKFEFDKAIGKKFMEEIEFEIEIETGVQEALKTLKE